MAQKKLTASERKRKAKMESPARRKSKTVLKGMTRDELNRKIMLKNKRKR